MDYAKNIITVGDKVVTIQAKEFDTDVDAESILQIDYNNIVGDIITFPVIFNRIAQLRADMESVVSQSKLEQGIFEAKTAQRIRKRLLNEKSKATKDEVDNAVAVDPEWIQVQRDHINRVRDFNIVDALYWSAKSKDGKLNAMTMKMRPEEFVDQLIEGTINDVMIKIKQGPIHQ